MLDESSGHEFPVVSSFFAYYPLIPDRMQETPYFHQSDFPAFPFGWFVFCEKSVDPFVVYFG